MARLHRAEGGFKQKPNLILEKKGQRKQTFPERRDSLEHVLLLLLLLHGIVEESIVFLLFIVYFGKHS